jgi:radical SAM protein with 4Fe4S-binding SPASM domain
MTATSIHIQDFPLWEKMIRENHIVSFDLEITARCNLNCRHCYINLPAGDPSARSRELSLSEIDQLASQAVDQGALWCLLSGGEPLLRPDFEDIYLLLKQKGLLISVFTNATLIQQRHIDLFRRYPPRDIEVTVYGVTPETYENVTRVPGSYAQFRKGLALLESSGVPVRLKAMAIRANLSEMDAIAAFCRQHTKDFYRFDPILHLRYDGDPVRNAEILAQRLTPQEIVDLESGDPDTIRVLTFHCNELIFPEGEDKPDDFLFQCKAGEGSFQIGYDGQFRVCESLHAPGTTCNLRSIPLAEARHNLIPAVMNIRSQKHSFPDTCRQCRIINLCMWCPALAYLETGDMEGQTDYFCRVAHARAAMLFPEKTDG